jgi:hypothetical protein
MQDMFDGSNVAQEGFVMAGRNGQQHLSTYVPEELAEAFKEWARTTDGGTAAAIRRLIAEAVDGTRPGPGPGPGLHGASPAQVSIAPRGVGRGEQVGVRLKASERVALAEAAKAQGTSPANWIRSLALVHLAHRPQWNPAELEALRDLFRELRAISNQLKDIAHGVSTAVQAGESPHDDVTAVREAAERVRFEMRRVVAVMTGNFDYWGLPDADRPTAAPGVMKRLEAQVQAAKAERKGRPRRRPARFADGSQATR